MLYIAVKHLEPALGLFFALHSQHQSLSSWHGETKLMLLAASIFRHIDDIAEIQGQVNVWRAIFGILEALWRIKPEWFSAWQIKNTFLLGQMFENIDCLSSFKSPSVIHLKSVLADNCQLLGPLTESLLAQQEGTFAAVFHLAQWTLL